MQGRDYGVVGSGAPSPGPMASHSQQSHGAGPSAHSVSEGAPPSVATRPPLSRAFSFDNVPPDRDRNKEMDARRIMMGGGGGGPGGGVGGALPPAVPLGSGRPHEPLAVALSSLLNRPPSTFSAVTTSPDLSQGSSSALSHSSTDGEQQPAATHQSQSQGGLQLGLPTRSPVYVIWDLQSVPLPSSLVPAYCVDRVHALADSYGYCGSFKAVGWSDPGSGLTFAVRHCLAERDVDVEEVFKSASLAGSIDLAVLTAIMGALVAAMQQQARNCTMVLLSNGEALARGLNLLRRSQLFSNLVVVHHSANMSSGQSPLLPLVPQEPQALLRAATASHEWATLLRHGLPPASQIIFSPIPHGGRSAHHVESGHHHGRHGERRDSHPRSSSFKELPSILGQQPQQQQPQQRSGSGNIMSSSHPSSVVPSASSSGFISRASTPSAGSRAGSGGGSLHSSAASSRSSSISSSPLPLLVDSSGRTMMGSVLDVPPSFDSESNNIAEIHTELLLERMPPNLRACVLALKEVLAYCERERIIPRESVLKKRLMDTPAAHAQSLNFEEILELAVSVGIAAVEGTAPQRIIYPAAGHTGDASAVRKFECADFFRPECLLLGTRVLLASGATKPAEQLSTADVLVGLKGRTVRLLQEPLVGRSDTMYTLTHADGSSYTVTPKHRLTLVWNVAVAIYKLPHQSVTQLELWTWRDGGLALTKHRATFLHPDSPETWLDKTHPLHDSSTGQDPREGARFERGTMFEMSADRLFAQRGILLPTAKESLLWGYREQPVDGQTEQLSQAPRTVRIVGIERVQLSGQRYVAIQVDGDGRFQLADGTVTHNSRLSAAQTLELVSWLSLARPEVDRGRFGYSQHLSMHAPPAIRALPHGVLVELVQLLLNQKILLFRKGRVSVNPNLAHADLRAVAALSVAAKPHTQLLSTHKGPQGQEAAAQLRLLYAQIVSDVDRYNEQRGMQLSPAFTSPGPGQQQGASGAGADSQQQSQADSSSSSGAHVHLTLEQFAHVREAQQRRSSMGTIDLQTTSAMTAVAQQQQRQAFSAPASPRPRQAYPSSSSQHPMPAHPPPTHPQRFAPGAGGSIATSLFNAGWPSVPPSPPQPSQADLHDEPLFLPVSQQQEPTHGSHMQTTRDLFQPTSPDRSSPTCLQVFEHKLLQSKWGPLALPLLSSGTHRFPFAPLWHLDLSALRSGTTIRERWSATCSFDVGDQLHTFSAFTQHDSAAAAQESLAQQLLQQDVCWRLVMTCVLHELKAKRRSTGSSMELVGPPVLRLLLQDKVELAVLERGEHQCAVRSARAIELQVAGSSVLRLDALLAARSLPAMIYSAEQVGIQGSRSRRAVWSVAAQLPPPLLLNRGSPMGAGSTVAQAAAAIKEDKMAAKSECAQALLDQLRRINPALLEEGGGTPRAPRATLSAHAPEWAPPSSSSSSAAKAPSNVSTESVSGSDALSAESGLGSSSSGSDNGHDHDHSQERLATD